MSDIRVHINHSLAPAHLERIKKVSPRINLTFTAFHAWLHGAGPVLAPPERAVYLKEAEVLMDVLGFFEMSEAPRLRWLQVPGAGVEKLWGKPIMSSDVIITNARIFATPISEYIIASMLAFSRYFPRAIEKVQKGREWPVSVWTEYLGEELSAKTIVIVGYGAIGQKTAQLARAFGMNVVAVRKSIDQPVQEDGITIYPSTQLHKVLPMADFVVVSLPLTPETQHIIGEAELRLMKPTSYLLNVGRGKLIENTALLKALREGWIGGVGMDVHDPNPPPADSPFRELPNVIMTPHMAGVTAQYYDRVTDLFCENLRRYIAGEPLLNVIDKTQGY